MTPGLIWVNPRFVHLDKSTNLEEASKKVGALRISKGLQYLSPLWFREMLFWVSISMNQ